MWWSGAMRGAPRGRERVITWLATALTRCFFRSVEAEGPALPAGPVILAASHLNGFVDPVVLVAELRAFPRFLAKATLWDVPVARLPLGFARVIPVQRRQQRAVVEAGHMLQRRIAVADPGVVQGHRMARVPGRLCLLRGLQHLVQRHLAGAGAG